jgi:hypothetical protein
VNTVRVEVRARRIHNPEKSLTFLSLFIDYKSTDLVSTSFFTVKMN